MNTPRKLAGAAALLLLLPLLLVLLPSPVAARANGPILQADYKLKELGFSDVVLQGIEPSVEFFFFGPQGVELQQEGTYIELVIAHSPLLLGDSTVSVELNSAPVSGRYLTPEHSQLRRIQIELPVEEIQPDVNSLLVRFFMRLSDDACVDGRNPALSATILADTTLHYAYADARPEVPPSATNIADFPAPVLYSYDPAPPTLDLVVPDSPSAADLSVALSLAGELGKTYQPFAEPVIRVLRAGQVTTTRRQLDSFILIGTPDANPLVAAALDGDLAWNEGQLKVAGIVLEPDSGIVAIAAEPWGGGQQTILVTGNSPAGLGESGRLLVTPTERLTVEQPISIVKAVTATEGEAIRTKQFEISLDQLGVGAVAWSGSGSHTVDFNVVAPPASQIDASELILELSHSPMLSEDSTVTVEINGTKVDSLRLDSVGFGREARSVSLPAAVLRAGSNDARIVVETFFGEPSECGGPPEVGAWAELRGETRLVIQPRGGVAAPDLSEFPYPFVLGLDTADVAVSVATGEDLEALGTLAIALGAWLNADTRWIPAVLDGPQDELGIDGRSYIVYGTPGNSKLLADLMPSLPLQMSSVDGRLVESPARTLVALPDNARIGILQVVQSPWNPRARFLVVAATDSAMLPSAVEALRDPDFPNGANLLTVSTDGRAGVLAVEMPLVEIDEVDVVAILIDNLPIEIAGFLLLAIAIGGIYLLVKSLRAGDAGRGRSKVEIARGSSIVLVAWVLAWAAAGFFLLPEGQRVLAILLLGVVALVPHLVLHRGSAPLALLAAIAALTALALEEAIGQGVDVAGRLAFSIAVLSVTTGIANYNAQRLRHLREDIVRQQRRIDDLTTLDLDTGAYKQEWGENRLSEEVGRSTRLRQPFALLLVSVTNWNEVVADHGPTGATDMLRLATDSIKRAQRTPDRVWRAGPSELAMLLPGTPLDGAEVVATRTVSSILEDAELNVVIGVAVFPADGDNPLALIAEAFSARDFAKMAGMPQASRRMLET